MREGIHVNGIKTMRKKREANEGSNEDVHRTTETEKIRKERN